MTERQRVLPRVMEGEPLVANHQFTSRPIVVAREAAIAVVPVPIAGANSSSLFQPILVPAVLILGSALTVAWTALLGYGLISLVGLAF